MATNNIGIKNSWSLVAFAKSHGKMKLASFINSETGEPFKSCAFVNGTDTTLVGFSSKLGELTPKEIVDRKDDLQVVELETGSFKLCQAGHDSWLDIDLGI